MNLTIIISISLIIPLLVLSVFSYAGEGMTDEQMQQMMKQAEIMQQCIAKIDQSALEKLATTGQEVEKDIKALCAAGKRDKAQDTAIAYGELVNSTKEMKEMQKCGELAKGMIQHMPMTQDLIKDYKNRHVCD